MGVETCPALLTPTALKGSGRATHLPTALKGFGRATHLPTALKGFGRATHPPTALKGFGRATRPCPYWPLLAPSPSRTPAA